MRLALSLQLWLLVALVGSSGALAEYLVGAGIADITGPAADINLMGYARPDQEAGGIHLRLFSRSIIVEDQDGSRILYTSLDNGMVSQLLRMQVLKRLGERFGTSMFNETNVMMSATHTHSAPGGFFQYMLYNIPSAGFIAQTLEALVDGIVLSVERANENVQPAKIYFTRGKLHDASVNRSPTSYANNPTNERSMYADNTDKTMYLLRIVDKSGEPMAMINWFAVHGTSMNNSNHLISSDNKGYASILFEQDFNPPKTLPGKGKFVAIFAQANEGDVSPNTRGPRCIDTGLPCDTHTSTCGNPPRNEKCIASGPGKDMFESTKIIAYKQYQKARQLFMDKSSHELISGPVRFIHEHIDMTRQVVPNYHEYNDLARRSHQRRSIQLNATYNTCKPALGYSFAAGTTDGPGAFDFHQGHTATSRYWNMVRDFLRKPSKESVVCQEPKQILLATGEMDFPYTWHPKVVPTQILMIGQLAIVGLPGEFTTMAGRRVRNAVQSIFTGQDVPTPSQDQIDSESSVTVPTNDFAKREVISQPATRQKRQTGSAAANAGVKVVLSGLSNIYTSYITTVEEYEVQRYEGGSTLYGPHTLQAYVNQFRRLASHLALGQRLEPNNLHPPDLTKSLFTIKAGVVFDGSPRGTDFGSILSDVVSNRTYHCLDTVNATFVAGNPRNDLRQEDSFIYVDQFVTKDGKETWVPIASDASLDTKYKWIRTSTLMGESQAVAEWEIPPACDSGVYRLRHMGSSKTIFQAKRNYTGVSSPFKVLSDRQEIDIDSLATQYVRAIETNRVEDIEVAHSVSEDYEDDQAIKRPAEKEDRVKIKAKVEKSDPSFMSPLKLLGSWFGSLGN